MTALKLPKKLIEVALPLDDINDACAIEKQPFTRRHPRSLHIWWARRPLAAARAVAFAQFVNDPGYERSLGRGVNKERAKEERERLFNLIRRLVIWENTSDEGLLNEAREEIKKSWVEVCALNRSHPDAATLFNPNELPAFHDPFAGGGAIPLEAQRLGFRSFASDLNPVPVLINKALIEFPPIFSARKSVGPIPDGEYQVSLNDSLTDSSGVAEDIRRYGLLLESKAKARIAGNYPPVVNGSGRERETLTPIAYLWARTVKSPNPAYSHIHVPLVSTFILSNKPGREAWVEPIVQGEKYHFEVHTGKPPERAESGTKAEGRGSNFYCLLSGSPIDGSYIKDEGKAGRLGSRLLAVVVEARQSGSRKGKRYIAPSAAQETAAAINSEPWRPSGQLPAKLTGGSCVPYGLTTWGDLFTRRQLEALNCFCDELSSIHGTVRADAERAWGEPGGAPARDGGVGPLAYADAITTYLALATSRWADLSNSLCSWNATNQNVRALFARQAIPMTWDYVELSPFGSIGSWFSTVESIISLFPNLRSGPGGWSSQEDAARQTVSGNKVVSTDPPYYDNIAYADLSDFFYVWLRRCLKSIYPALFGPMSSPKDEELVAASFRHGGKSAAEKFFLDGMTEAMRRLAEQAHPAFPTTIYYAFKQSDTTDLGTGNTGWETFLEAVLTAGFSITGTWPMRTERDARAVGLGANALASSIVLVCRKRDPGAASISRRDFIRELKDELREAVDVMIGGGEGLSALAPVDLAQAVIGPGMAIFSKYSAVLEADGKPMSIHTALTIINRMLTEGADDFDVDTQFCLGWFEEQGWSAGEFGKADVLSRAKGTSVDHVRDAGVVKAGSGKVRLLKPSEYQKGWSPAKDSSTPVWEALHQMIRALKDKGETASGELLAGMPDRAEPIRSLAYRLYTLCERKGWADDARAYNELITSWTGIEAASHQKGHVGSQTNLEI